MAHKYFDEAQIMTAYTLNSWFVTVAPWFEGDKMLFSFVKKGTAGKNPIKVYVSLRKFEKLIEDIESGKFSEVLAKDTKDDNPSAWTYRTGNKGSKNLAIGLGKANDKTGKRNICIHGYDAGLKANADVPVSWDDILELKDNYRLIVGPKPIDNCWHKMLWEAFWNAYEKKKKYFEDEDMDDTEETVSDEPTAENLTETHTEPKNEPSIEKESTQSVILKSYKKEGDVISFESLVADKPAILRVNSADMSGKDNAAWKKASKELSDGEAKIVLNLRHVRKNEFTVLGVAE